MQLALAVAEWYITTLNPLRLEPAIFSCSFSASTHPRVFDVNRRWRAMSSAAASSAVSWNKGTRRPHGSSSRRRGWLERMTRVGVHRVANGPGVHTRRTCVDCHASVWRCCCLKDPTSQGHPFTGLGHTKNNRFRTRLYIVLLGQTGLVG